MNSGHRTILLTGASGALGDALVERLGGQRLVCLVRRSQPRDDGVEIVRGDLTEPRLGLGEREYEELTRSVDCVVHAGAVTDLMATAAKIRAANVDGTQRVLELAQAADAQLVFVSTAFAMNGADGGEPEPDADSERSDPHVGARAYAASKREAEALLAASGVPHAVVRTSIVAGDSRTGAIGKFQGLHGVLGMIAQGRLPMLPVVPDRRVDFLPRDVMADALGAVVESGAREGSYWLTAGRRALTVSEVVETAAAFGRENGSDAAVPRYIEPDAVDRLIRPVFMSKLPPDVANELERLFALFALVETAEPFPSSLDELGVPPPDLLRALEANLRFWRDSELKPAAGVIEQRADDLEAWLVARLAEQLEVEGVEPGTAFADLGLDSVGAAEIAEDMEAEFGQHVAVMSFFEYANAHELAHFLVEEREAA